MEDNKIDSKKEMDKTELVYTLSLMLDCIGFEDQLNKMSMPALFRIYDDMHQRGSDYCNLESDIRKSAFENSKLQGTIQALTQRLKVAERQAGTRHSQNKPRYKRG